MFLIRDNLSSMTVAEKDNVCKAFEWALPSLLTFSEEVDLWKTKWLTPGIHVAITLAESLESCNNRFFPNIYTCLHLLMVSPVSTAAVEHSHSALKIVKLNMQSTM